MRSSHRRAERVFCALLQLYQFEKTFQIVLTREKSCDNMKTIFKSEGECVMYKTKQRQDLLDFMRSNVGQHVSIHQIYQHFKAQGKPIGLTTIYRYIDKLSEEGLIRKYNAAGANGASYEYVDEEQPRISFQCDVCGKIEHIQCENFNHTAQHMFEDHGIRLNTRKTIFYGECHECGERTTPNK